MTRWNARRLTGEFVSESCCFADVDGDGAAELVAGDSWWRLDGTARHQFRTIEAAWLPAWPHDPRQDPFPALRRSGGLPQYRASTYDWPCRLSGGAGVDILSIAMHRDPIVWHENPGDGQGRWRTHTVTDGGIYESAVLARFGVERSTALVTVPEKGSIAWFEPPADPRNRWIAHLVGTEGGDWHGLGVGDVDGDNQAEILCKRMVYRATSDIRAPWTPMRLSQVLDDGRCVEGLGDVCLIHVTRWPGEPWPVLISSSPHARGVWMWTLCDSTAQQLVYRRHTLDERVSQVHSLRIDTQSPGGPWVIAGKRWQAHGADGDVGAGEPPVMFEIGPGAGAGRERHLQVFHTDSGVGLHFDLLVRDNALFVATSNKKGVHLFTRPLADAPADDEWSAVDD